MLQAAHLKYQRPTPVDLPDRQWPSRLIEQAPVWLSTDLRDGNQALFEPMNRARKLTLWHELVRLGFKEIETGFPAGSQIDFDFMRSLIDDNLIPPDVTPMVMTQLREEQIVRTVQSLRGARRAIVHFYNAVAPLWRQVVFGMSVPQVMALVERNVRLLKELTAQQPETEWILQYSPETFCMAELEVSLQACQVAIDTWDAGPQRPIIINLPTTVEVSTPNIFADQIEWMDRHLPRRQHVMLSVHPHNDRGTGVACAEQALLAGAQRVEGCLFGNGERSGNLDVVTLALNLYTNGIDPGLDFSDINGVARIAESCTRLPIHPRHPYAGDLVFTAFSGSHQDAIKKGFAAQAAQGMWAVPYLPIDPQDIGRTYDSIVRVNSQSGKGGIAFLLERDHGVVMPRRMQVEFSAIVQRHADTSESEIDSAQLWQLFEETYLTYPSAAALRYCAHQLRDLASAAPSSQVQEGTQMLGIELEISMHDQRQLLHGSGNGPIAATVAALAQLLTTGSGGALRIDSYEERSIGSGAGAQAWAVVEAALPGVAGTRFGVGRHANLATASILAVVSAAARLIAVTTPSEQT